jgi:alpha-mannosidase
VTQIESDISTDPKWRNDPTPLGNGRAVIYRLFGVGDVGGAPQAASVDWLAKSLANKNGAVEVRNTSVDQLANDLTPQEKAALPVYEGELTMKTHGVGTHSSQAAMKMLNRANELLADAAERASVAAEWLTGLEYPAARLREAWTRGAVASLSRRHHRHLDPAGVSVFLERRVRVVEPVGGVLDERNIQRVESAGHAGSGDSPRRLQPDGGQPRGCGGS